MSECTPEEQAYAEQSGGNFLCFSRGQMLGAAARAEAGVVSLLAITITFTLVVRNVVRCIRYPPTQSWSLFSKPADIYVFFILFFDLIHCTARVLDFKWVKEGKVYTGNYCTTIGTFQQIGGAGSAQLTFAMAAHNFVTVWCRKGSKARWIATTVVTFVFLYNLLFVSIGVGLYKGENPYIAPANLWCWVGPGIPNSQAVRMAGQYAWVYMALVGTYVFYIPLYLWGRGNVTIDDRRPWSISIHRRNLNRPVKRSLGILALPVVYAVTALPTSVARWYDFAHPHRVNDATLFAVSAIYGLTGFFNCLLLFARPEVLLFGKSRSNRALPAALPPDTTPRGGSRADVNFEPVQTPRSPYGQYSPNPLLQHSSEGVQATQEGRGAGPLPADGSDDEEIAVVMRERPVIASNWVAGTRPYSCGSSV